MTEPTHRVVAVANGKYATLEPLARAVPDTAEIVNLLEHDHGFTGVLIDDLPQGELLAKVKGELRKQSLPGGVLVLLWIGHGQPGPGGQLLLMSRATDTYDDEVANAAQLGAWAAQTGAAQVLVIVDTCFSGAGVGAALTMADAVFTGRADPTTAWFGVIAASRSDESSLSGALPRELKRLLTEGPKDERLRVRWGVYDARVRGDDVIDALLKEWGEPRHSPQQASTGNAWPMLRNPLYRPKAQHRVVEHLLQAARGTSLDGAFFTGRESELAQIVSWIRAAKPGVCVVTGPAGSGKSAILGRIASLSDSWERARLLAIEPVDPSLDPGEGRVGAQLHCRAMDSRAAIENIAAQLELAADASIYDILSLAQKRRTDGRPMLVLLDGLDEAGDAECRSLALEVAQPLSREAMVLVGTRAVPGASGEPGLIGLLGATTDTINLGAQAETTLHDVRRYIVRRLDGVSGDMNPDAVAEEIVTSARAHDPTTDGPFLLARLITSQLRDVPVDTNRDDWKESLATSVVTALERDLERTVLVIGDRAHPTAARELLRALSCVLGSGFPADDVWPAVATALSASGTIYTRDDAYTLLEVLGRHVVAGAEGDQGVFRIAHQRLVDHLRPVIGRELGRRLHPDAARPIATAVATLYESLLDQGQSPQQHTYLWRHAWRHLADAGLEGIALLRRFVARDRDAFLPDLSLALARVGTGSFVRGSPQEAIALHREAVEIRRELGKPIDLAMSLFDLSFALGGAGDSAGSDEAAEQASDVARSAADEPTGKQMLAATLSAQALTQFLRGNPRASIRMAEEAMALIETDLDANPSASNALAAALYLTAQAALAMGDMERANDCSRRAVALLEARGEPSPWRDALMMDALVIRANVELLELSARLGKQQATGVPTVDDRPRPLAAARLVALSHNRGPTGTISDISSAEGLRILAVTTLVERQLGWATPDAPDPETLLNKALPLLKPLTGGSAEAMISMATVRLVRAPLIADRDIEGATAELLDLERELRAATPSVRLGARLGLTLDMLVDFGLATGGDIAQLVAREREAISLLTPATDRFLRNSLAQAWRKLMQILEQHVSAEEAADARERAVPVLREAHDGSLMSAVLLAGTLSDIAGDCVRRGRALEALAFADEALSLLNPLEGEHPALGMFIGVAELNRSVALMVVERAAEARRGLDRALALLDVDASIDAASGWLAITLHNLSLLDLVNLKYDAALDHATRALALFALPDVPSTPSVLALAHINRGRALRGCGRQAEGDEELRQGLAQLRAMLTSDAGTVALLAQSLDGAGAETWNEVIADLHDQPALVRELSLMRARPAEHVDETVRLLNESLLEDADDGARQRLLRTIARRERRRDVAAFDAQWQLIVGAIPDWLRVDLVLDRLFLAWVNTSTWTQSRDFLLTNLSLLDPGTDILIAEWLGDGLDAGTASTHLELLERSRAIGIDAAYAPTLARQAVEAWKETDLSSEYLTEHLEQLTAPTVVAWLTERSADGDAGGAGVEETVLAILTLTRRGEQFTAYRMLRDRVFADAQVEQALRTDDPERSHALTALHRAFEQERLPVWYAAPVSVA